MASRAEVVPDMSRKRKYDNDQGTLQPKHDRPGKKQKPDSTASKAQQPGTVGTSKHGGFGQRSPDPTTGGHKSSDAVKQQNWVDEAAEFRALHNRMKRQRKNRRRHEKRLAETRGDDAEHTENVHTETLERPTLNGATTQHNVEEQKLRSQQRNAESKGKQKAAQGEQSVSKEKDIASTVPKSSTPNTVSDGQVKDDRSQKPQRKAAKKAKRSAEENAKQIGTKSWTEAQADLAADSRRVSAPSEGHFLSHDPAFVRSSEGEDFLIAANEREVQVLSLETSLVVRKNPAPAGQKVLCFAVDETSSSSVYIAYSDRTVRKWDWADERSTARAFKAKRYITAMAFGRPSDQQRSPAPYCIYSSRHGSEIVYDGVVLYTTAHKLVGLQVLGTGQYVLARGSSALIVGVRNATSNPSNSFTWSEMPLEVPSTCVDAQLLSSQTSGKKGSSTMPALRLAIGNEEGKIHLYDDISSLFRSNAPPPSPRLLHWHREAVSSTKFSKDGNYLISAGTETVLVLWQLSTGKKQFLPHLTSDIERIVVSPEGDRYAVQMSDNSIVALNTSELKPVAYFAGLQMHQASPWPPAAVLHPRHPNHLLLTISTAQRNAGEDTVTRPFLQTYDVGTSRQVTRQALTRNNVTDFNLSPEGTPIIPPDVLHLAISHDGAWLATIDEWMPPATDMVYFANSAAEVEAERLNRREIHLKFWLWEEEQNLWTLTTRVDSPHHRGGRLLGGGKVYALVASPNSKRFATLGEDGYIRLWKPRTRMRHGVAVKDERDIDVVDWRCKRSIRLEWGDGRVDSPIDASHPRKSCAASLAYSSDGSMLAAARAMGDNSTLPTVHFIDTAKGDIMTKPGLAAAEITAVGFVNRYFIAVSRPAVYVWDLIDDELMYKISIPEPGNVQTLSSSPPLLAINETDGTFVLAVSTRQNERTSMEIYRPQDKKYVYKESFETRVAAVLSGSGSRGYTLLFANATLRTLSPGGVPASQVRLMSSTPQANEGIPAPADEPADAGTIDLVNSVHPADGQSMAVEDDRPVVRPEQLAGIFEGGTLPPMRNMVQAVFKLCAPKP